MIEGAPGVEGGLGDVIQDVHSAAADDLDSSDDSLQEWVLKIVADRDVRSSGSQQEVEEGRDMGAPLTASEEEQAQLAGSSQIACAPSSSDAMPGMEIQVWRTRYFLLLETDGLLLEIDGLSVTSIVRILFASTLSVLIELLQIMIQSLKVSPKSPFLLEGPHLLDPLLFVRYARCPPSVWHCAVLGSSTSMEMTRIRGLAFILVFTAILLKLAIIGKVARRLVHSLRSMLNGLHKQRLVRLS